VETADWHTARSGSGGSTSVLLGVSEYDLDERGADPQIRNRREVDSSLVHVGVACCHWTVVATGMAKKMSAEIRLPFSGIGIKASIYVGYMSVYII
jgi:hypothetical protein